MSNGIAQGVYTDWFRGTESGFHLGTNIGVSSGNYADILLPLEIIKNGLIIYLDARFPKSYPRSGTRFSDLSGRGINATLINSPVFDSGNNGSFTFNGSTSSRYIDTNYNIPWRTGEATYCVWFKFTSSQTGALIINRISTNFELFGLYIANDSGGNTAGSRVACSDYNAAGRQGITTGTYGDGLWHYAVGVRSSSSLRIYVDGELQSTVTASAPNLPNSSKIFVGCSSNDGINPALLYFNGSIASVQVYNRALSAFEVQINYTAMKAVFNR